MTTCIYSKRTCVSRTCIYRRNVFVDGYGNIFNNPYNVRTSEIKEDVLCTNPRARWNGLTIYVGIPVDRSKQLFPRAKSRCHDCSLKTYRLKEEPKTVLDEVISK